MQLVGDGIRIYGYIISLGVLYGGNNAVGNPRKRESARIQIVVGLEYYQNLIGVYSKWFRNLIPRIVGHQPVALRLDIIDSLANEAGRG